MINIKIICVGDLKENYLKEMQAEYTKRLSKYCKLEKSSCSASCEITRILLISYF